MRHIALILGFVLIAPLASAEFGTYDAHGYPLDVDGHSTWPGMSANGPVNVAGPATVYPYWPILTAEVQRLAMEHPDLVKVHTAGKSTAGLDLWMLEIADFTNPAMKPLETREVVWVDGGTHSNEYSGVYFTAHLASFLLDEYATNETAQWIVENRHTWIMPLVNPDGSNAFGRLNANLVNINRNYPVVWDGEGNDMLMNNRGPTPASEVETRINIEWFNKTKPDYYASIHCCGNLWLYPYGEEGVDPVDNEVLSRVCEDAFPTVREDCGPIWSTIYPASGSSVDTVYEYTGAVAFGYEMSGRGALAIWGQPFTTVTVREQEVESWNGVLHAFMNVHRYGAHPVVTSAHVVADGIAITVMNDGHGNLTAGTARFGDDTPVALPFMAPGASASLVVPATATAGDTDIVLDYVKRVAASPSGTSVARITLATSGGALSVVALNGESLMTNAASESPASVPGIAPIGVLLVAASLAFARRR